MKKEQYKLITDQIVEALESERTLCSTQTLGAFITRFNIPLRHNGKAYQGCNILGLVAQQMLKQLPGRYWFTFKQVTAMSKKDAPIKVKAGSKGSKVYYGQSAVKLVEADDGTTVEERFGFLKMYTVFNSTQIEGLPEDYYKEMIVPEFCEIESCEEFASKCSVKIKHNGTKSNAALGQYSPIIDVISMHTKEMYRSSEHYYSVLFHELIHATGHSKRLDRKPSCSKRTDSYKHEELVAEIGAAFLCQFFNFKLISIDEHASYLDGYIKAMKKDPQVIFRAAAQAQKACNWLLAKAGMIEDDKGNLNPGSKPEQHKAGGLKLGIRVAA